ncbi:uncharacterized protein LOC120278620 [Dioscorea cayenensis subsp. rotundata]|uniref:Uncharacterized protein LOC120278620 n=1 Tax=Dioscorea cayennensis subsp. rotundata TaxID=55577 RepID=A0AB40CMR7_DIOCR|nr:uncharacterized protein LOC120278620 [Dioscorea cayenensis subsp. rotundata]
MVVERIGAVAYKLQLLEDARIHNVFHISQLKKKIGDQIATTRWPAFLNETQEMQKIPITILDRQLVKRFNKAGVKILVQWSNSPPEEATWEFLDVLQRQFPEFCS